MPRTPLYRAVFTDLKRRIESGELVPNANGRLPTQADLAAGYSVSLITVKRAIAALEKINLVTSRRGRGLELCQAPDARRNAGPRRLLRIGVGVASMCSIADSPFIAQHINGLEAFCRTRQVQTLFFNFPPDPRTGTPTALVTQLARLEVDGLLFLSPVTCQAVAYLQDNDVPNVHVANLWADENAVCHYDDPVLKTFKVTDAIARRGLRRIVVFVGAPRTWGAELAVTGHRLALEAHGLPFCEEAILYADHRSSEPEALVARWIDEHGPMDAVRAFDDVRGGVIKRYLNAKGMGHILVAGCGNIEREQAHITITTDNRASEIAYNALHMLCDMIDGKQPKKTKFCYEPKLIERPV